MTREEAIKIFKALLSLANAYDVDLKSSGEAMQMAIEVLQDVTDTNVGGLISRQAAIALGDNLKDDLPDDEQIAGAVMAHNEGILGYQTAISLLPSALLPSAQPEIIRCLECKYYREYGYVSGKPTFLPRCTFNSIYVNAAVDFCSKAERRTGGDGKDYSADTSQSAG